MISISDCAFCRFPLAIFAWRHWSLIDSLGPLMPTTHWFSIGIPRVRIQPGILVPGSKKTKTQQQIPTLESSGALEPHRYEGNPQKMLHSTINTRANRVYPLERPCHPSPDNSLVNLASPHKGRAQNKKKVGFVSRWNGFVNIHATSDIRTSYPMHKVKLWPRKITGGQVSWENEITHRDARGCETPSRDRDRDEPRPFSTPEDLSRHIYERRSLYSNSIRSIWTSIDGWIHMSTHVWYESELRVRYTHLPNSPFAFRWIRRWDFLDVLSHRITHRSFGLVYEIVMLLHFLFLFFFLCLPSFTALPEQLMMELFQSAPFVATLFFSSAFLNSLPSHVQ